MKQKLIRIIKSLKDFTFDEIQTMTECDNEETLQEILKELLDTKFIIQTSEKHYSIKKVSSKPTISKKKVNFDNWVKNNCNGDLNNLSLKTIDPCLFFDKKTETEHFNNLNAIQKRNVIKYYILYKATTNLMGKTLYKKVRDISNQYPALKCAPETVVAKNRAYRLEGINAFVPREGYLPPKRFSQEVLNKFENLYLNPKRYSYQHCIKLLEKEFDPVDIPADTTMSKYLKKKYSMEYILAKRNPSPEIYNSNKYASMETEKIDFKTMKFIDAAHKFMKERHSEGSFSFLQTHLIPYFKDTELKDISQNMAEDFQDIKISEGYSIASVRCMMNILNHIYKEYMDTNNVAIFKFKKILPIREQECLSIKEINKLISDKSPKLWTICLGISPQELAALNYNDINFKEGTVKIDKIYQKTRFRKYFHLHAIRTLKLHPILLDMLDKKGTGVIYENVDMDDSTVLLNTHVKLLLDKNVPMNVICKNLGYKNLYDFEMRFNFLFQKELDKDFDILAKAC